VKPKIGKNALGCVLYALLVIAALAALLFVAAAKSGIVVVPYLHLYTGPVPAREVCVTSETIEDAIAEVKEAVIAPGAFGERELHTVTYTEAEATAAIRAALADAAARGEADPEKTFIVIRPDVVQLTGKFWVKGLPVNAQIEFVPSAQDGLLVISITKARFGDIPVAPSVAKLALDAAFGRDSSVWNIDVADHEIHAVELGDGALTLTLF